MSAPSVESERETIPVGGASCDVRVVTAGVGPPLLCCHGIGLDAATVAWRPLLDSLAATHTVHAIDFPNHGESAASDAVETMADYVAVVEAVVATRDLEGAAMAGLSMGGAAVLGHALGGGEPSALVLLDSYGLGADAPWRTWAGAAVRLPFADSWLAHALDSQAGVRSTLQSLVGNGVPEDLVEDVTASVTPASLRAMRRWQRHEFRPDGLRTNYRPRLGDLDVPTLLIHGERDPLLPVEWSRAAAEELPDGRLVALDGVGHWPTREAPERVASEMAEFLEGRRES